MKRKIFFKMMIAIVALVLLIRFLTTIFVEPWLGKKIHAELYKELSDYIIEIDKVHILIIKSGIELKGITIYSRQEYGGAPAFNAGMVSIKFKGINLAKAIFKNDIYIREVSIDNSTINGNIPFSEKEIMPIVSPLNIRIAKVLFNNLDLAMGKVSTAQSYMAKGVILKVDDLQFEKQDTISSGIFKQFYFEAEELISVSSDSTYTFSAGSVFIPQILTL